MSTQKTTTIYDADGRERVVVELPADKGLPTKIVKTPKKITTHVENEKGSSGEPMDDLNGKNYKVRTPKKQSVFLFSAMYYREPFKGSLFLFG